MFEFWINVDNRTLGLVVGPGPDETRQKLFSMARAHPGTFDDPWKAVGAWYVIYSNEFLNREMYEEASASDREEEIRRKWSEFVQDDLPRINDEIRQTGWIWGQDGT